MRLVQRPAHLRADTTPMNDVLLSTVRHLEGADLFVQTHATNPILRPRTIASAIDTLLGYGPKYDSLFSVTRRHVRLWDHAGQPINHDPARLLRTQDLAPVFEENSCLYLFTRDSLETCRSRIGRSPLMFEIPAVEATDIDEELDFRVAEILFQQEAAKSQGKAA